MFLGNIRLMLLRIIYIFSIFSILTASAVEVKEIAFNTVQAEKVHCADDQHKEHSDCNDEENCCEKHSACISSFYIATSDEVSCVGSPISSKVDCNYNIHYHPPFPDLVFRPPLFS